jgi:deltex-like protein
MITSLVNSSCDGYPGFSLAIHYKLTGGLSRVAYLPNTPRGLDILAKLQIAFDRRLVFSLGVSLTTGVPGPVWSIHHKTSISGGVGKHGYPDAGYLDRVAGELRERGVE